MEENKHILFLCAKTVLIFVQLIYYFELVVGGWRIKIKIILSLILRIFLGPIRPPPNLYFE